MIRYYWNRHIAWKSGESTSESEFVASRSVIINHVKTEKMKYFSIQCSPIYGVGGGLFGRFPGFAHLSFW